MRTLAYFLLTRRPLALVVVFALVATGLLTFARMHKTEDPVLSFPSATVVISLPGANALRMEQSVAMPIEAALRSLGKIKRIRSINMDGVTSVTVEFLWGVDPEEKYNAFVNEVNRQRQTLPAGVTEINFVEWNTAQANILQLALVSDNADERILSAIADDVVKSLIQVPGVQQARTWGAFEPEVQIQLDTNKLATLELPPQAVIDKVQERSEQYSIGELDFGERRLNVDRFGGFSSLASIAEIPIRNVSGAYVTIGDVASVTWGHAEVRHLTRLDGERAVFITVRGVLGADVIGIRDRVVKVAEKYAETFPADVRLEIVFDQTVNIKNRLQGLGGDFLLAVLVVSLTLLPLGFRASLVVMITIPLSLAIGLVAIRFMGFSLNQLTIAGFVVALGLLVDDAIVVTESIARHVRNGRSPIEAAKSGLEEIDTAVLGSTAAVLLAFLPLAFIPAIAGDFIRSLPVAVLSVVAASFFVSIVIVPYLSSALIQPRFVRQNRFYDVVTNLINSLYRPILRTALARPKSALLFSAFPVLLSFLLLPSIGVSLFPPSDSPLLIVEVETPHGTGLPKTDETIAYLEKSLLGLAEVAWVMSNTGRDNPPVFYNFIRERSRTNIGSLLVGVKPEFVGDLGSLETTLNERFGTRADARIVVQRFSNGPPLAAPIEIRVVGPSLHTLSRIAEEVEEVIAQTAGSSDVRNSLSVVQTSLALNLDEAKAALLNVNAGTVDLTVRALLEGVEASTYTDQDGQIFPVVVVGGYAHLANVDDIRRMHVWSIDGEAVRLSDVSAPMLFSSPSLISRIQGDRVARITARAGPGFLASDVVRSARERLGALNLPVGYAIIIGGEAEAATESFGGLETVAAISVFGILAVLLLEFGTFARMTVISLIFPIGLLGGIFALWVTGEPFSFTAAIGFITLLGIEIKNSILFVDLADKLQSRGVDVYSSVVEAGEIRFFPVLLTTLTAVAGLTPLALHHSGLYSPLAIVVIGGLLSALLIGRVVTPVLYLLVVAKASSSNDGQPASIQ